MSFDLWLKVRSGLDSRKRLAENESDAQSQYLLGLLLFEITPSDERTKEAEQRFKTAVTIEPDQGAANLAYAKLLLRLKRPLEAIPLLEHACELDQYDISALNTLRGAYAMAGKTKEAEVVAEQFAQLSKYVERGRFLEDQMRRQPLNAKIHFQYAEHLEEGGQKAKAKFHLDAAYMLQKDPAKAIKGINALSGASNNTNMK